MNNELDIFLDAIILRVYDQSADSTILTSKLIELHDTYHTKMPTLNTPAVLLYRNVLEAISEDGIDLSNESEVELLIAKLADSNTMKGNRSAEKKVATIITKKKLIDRLRITRLKKKIISWIQWFKTTQANKEMFRDLSKYTTTIDDVKKDALLSSIVENAADVADKFGLTTELSRSSAIESIDMGDKISVDAAVKTLNQVNEDSAGFTMGLQGLNDLLYPTGCIGRGESVAFMAPSHGFKSAMLMNVARWIAMLNTPPECTGIPTIVFYSFENEIYRNLHQWFKDVYMNMYHEPIGDKTDEEIVSYIVTAFAEKGYRLLVFRLHGEYFGLSEYKSHIESLEKKGFEIVAAILDYITLMNYDPMPGGNDAKRIQVFAHRLFSYNKHKMISSITGLQVKAVTNELVKAGKRDMVKHMRVEHLADCKGLYRELDCGFWMDIEENHEKELFLTMAWAKRRYHPRPPKIHKYKAWPFTKLGIYDDIGKPDSSTKDIYEVVAESVSDYDVMSVL